VADKKLNVSQLKEFLSHHLPFYMIPSHMMQIDSIPLTANGKVDKRALPEPEFDDSEIELVMPTTDHEKVIADIWKGILGIPEIGIYHNFFDMGGNSLDLIRVNAKIKEMFQLDVPIVVLFRYPTINSLVQYVTGGNKPGDFPQRKKEIFNAIDKSKDKLKERIQRRRGRTNERI
jgi:surfactin family lipopeptide synthetase B